MASIPQATRQLRACLVCSIVKNAEQFKREGCDNCDHFLQLKNHPEKVSECTSSTFDGYILLAQWFFLKPTLLPLLESWAAQYKKIDQYVTGIYAVGVTGRIPEWVEDEMSRRDIQYIPRDGSSTHPN
ncbi:7436_t:CDS:2 [Acaulospora morrowiae]|uniref:Transcription elongation factor SPT4 n=1 Tax=Acaulospora morrowiae TaxID=94023 RepID=A0A9N9AL43_9GLOM|nr:7436_t:CDS:2 [Acaulospora morrowiae]